MFFNDAILQTMADAKGKEQEVELPSVPYIPVFDMDQKNCGNQLGDILVEMQDPFMRRKSGFVCLGVYYPEKFGGDGVRVLFRAYKDEKTDEAHMEMFPFAEVYWHNRKKILAKNFALVDSTNGVFVISPPFLFRVNEEKASRFEPLSLLPTDFNLVLPPVHNPFSFLLLDPAQFSAETKQDAKAFEQTDLMLLHNHNGLYFSPALQSWLQARNHPIALLKGPLGSPVITSLLKWEDRQVLVLFNARESYYTVWLVGTDKVIEFNTCRIDPAFVLEGDFLVFRAYEHEESNDSKSPAFLCYAVHLPTWAKSNQSLLSFYNPGNDCVDKIDEKSIDCTSQHDHAFFTPLNCRLPVQETYRTLRHADLDLGDFRLSFFYSKADAPNELVTDPDSFEDPDMIEQTDYLNEISWVSIHREPEQDLATMRRCLRSCSSI